MGIKDRLRKLQAGAPEGCPQCADWGDGYQALVHDPDECARIEQEAGYPQIRSNHRFRDYPQREIEALAAENPDLWRCGNPPRGEMPEPCPGCGRESVLCKSCTPTQQA